MNVTAPPSYAERAFATVSPAAQVTQVTQVTTAAQEQEFRDTVLRLYAATAPAGSPAAVAAPPSAYGTMARSEMQQQMMQLQESVRAPRPAVPPAPNGYTPTAPQMMMPPPPPAPQMMMPPPAPQMMMPLPGSIASAQLPNGDVLHVFERAILRTRGSASGQVAATYGLFDREAGAVYLSDAEYPVIRLPVRGGSTLTIANSQDTQPLHFKRAV